MYERFVSLTFLFHPIQILWDRFGFIHYPFIFKITPRSILIVFLRVNYINSTCVCFNLAGSVPVL